MAKAADYGETEQWETSDALVAEYLAYDNGQDNGAVIADLLLAWYRQGRSSRSPRSTTPTRPPSTRPCRHSRASTVGVDLTDDADQLFGEGQPWTVANGEQPDPSEGHCVVKFKADGRELDWYGTWGALQAATREWSGVCVVECWVIITSEDEAAKVDMPALVADIEALRRHGRHPAPVIPPAPQPAPYRRRRRTAPPGEPPGPPGGTGRPRPQRRRIGRERHH